MKVLVTAIAEHGLAKAGEQRRSVLDAALARRAFGWAPRMELTEGLARTAEYFARQTG